MNALSFDTHFFRCILSLCWLMEGVLEECGEWVDESWPRFLFFFMFCLNVKWLWSEREGDMTFVNRPASFYICICIWVSYPKDTGRANKIHKAKTTRFLSRLTALSILSLAFNKLLDCRSKIFFNFTEKLIKKMFLTF